MNLEILALGARTGIGLSAETSAAAARSGICRVREFPYVTGDGVPMMVATVPRVADDVMGRDRLLSMLNGVLDEIRTKLGPIDLSRGGCETMLALPEDRPGFSSEDAHWIGQRTQELLAARGIRSGVRLGGRGHAGGIESLARVASLAAHYPQYIHLVIGLDSYVDLATFGWLEARGQFAQPGNRTGFIPGEGVGALVVAPPAVCRTLRWPSLATIVGIGTAQETLLRDSETGSFGRGLTEAVVRATAGVLPSGHAADDVYSDINGERYRSEEWGFFAMREYRSMKTLAYQACCDCWGDTGAASGLLASVIGVRSLVRGYGSGPAFLVTAGSESGLRGALLIRGDATSTSFSDTS